MSRLKLGELCAGYGGLGMAVEEVFNADTAWFSEFDAAPSKILAHHWPHVPNYGDMTKIDWAAIEPVDIISGGTPCQDLSAAGRRKGMTEGTRSNLWVQMREAIAIQRPRYVVWENVRGAFSAEASSDLEQCSGCVGDTSDGRVFLRALGRVLGDLSDLGYDTQWRGLRASDVGAPHARFRVFVLAENADLATGSERRQSASRQAESGRTRPNAGGRGGTPIADSDNPGRSEQRRTFPVQPEHSTTEYAGLDAADAKSIRRGEGWAESEGIERGLSTAGNSPSAPDAFSAGARIHARPGGQGWKPADTWGPALVRPGDGAAAAEGRESGDSERDAPTAWGDYEPAIRRWEARLGRPAPRPTEPTGRNNSHRLSPTFCEWMMGLPEGWVTDPAIGISRNEQLKACGNGVVPQQAMAALRDMLAAFQTAEVAA